MCRLKEGNVLTRGCRCQKCKRQQSSQGSLPGQNVGFDNKKLRCRYSCVRDLLVSRVVECRYLLLCVDRYKSYRTSLHEVSTYRYSLNTAQRLGYS